MRKTLLLFLLITAWLTACQAAPDETKPTSTPADAAQETPSPTPTQEPLALLVNGEGISLAAYQDELYRLQSAEAALGRPGDPDIQAQRVADYLIDELLLSQGAREQGYTVTDETLQARIAALQNEQGEQQFADWLDAQHYTLTSFRAALRRQMEAVWMRDQIIDAVPYSSEQMHVFQILLYNEEDAQTAFAALQSGEDFETLAQQYDPQTGGNLGWIPAGYLLEPALNAALASLQTGAYSEIIATPLGYHILYVQARETRSLSTDARLFLQNQALADWLDARRAASNIRFAP